jgi:Rod binding domain-containing protein
MTDMSPLVLPSTDMATLGGAPMALSMKMGPGADIDKTAQDFEAMFATQLLQPMFETVSVDPVFGGGHGEEIMRSFMLQEYGKIIAKTGKLGIAKEVRAEMLKAQEGAGARPGLPRGKNPYVTAATEGSHVTVQ